MGEPGRIQAFLGWWRELPTGWRVNVGLYVLAGVSLIALLTQVVVGGDSRPRRVEVAAGRRAPPRPTTSAIAPSTTEPPATTVAPTTAPPTTAGRSSPATTRGAGGGGGRSSGGGGSPSPITFAPTTPPPVECERNSTDDRCGPFSWDPPPGENADLGITVTGPTSARVGEQVVFNVRVTDPDHLVTGNCRRADFGDGTDSPGPCAPAPCPPARGVWDTPPKQPGSNEFTYAHRFAREGTFRVTFTFHTNKDRCPDPYGSEGSRSVSVTVTPAGT